MSSPLCPPRITLFALFALAAALSACSGDAVECISDVDCPEGEYCVSTRCASPTPVGDARTAYQTQVAPVVETGCNCHGPTSGRPWIYDHDFGDPAAFDESLRLLRQWLYDPVGGRPAAGGYGLAICGHDHPGIYGDTEEPQYQLIAQWAAASYTELPPSPPADFPAPAATPPPDGPLPAREQAALEAIRTLGYEDELATVIGPRISGQCGCCHTLGGNRVWQIPNTRPLSPADAMAVGAAIGRYVNRADPDQSALLRYGLGDFGRTQAHPVIYSGVDDPRYRLLRAWIAEGDAPP